MVENRNVQGDVLPSIRVTIGEPVPDRTPSPVAGGAGARTLTACRAGRRTREYNSNLNRQACGWSDRTAAGRR